MSLAGPELRRDRQAIGVDNGMDFRGQSAPRAPHASGVSCALKGGERGFGAALFFPFFPFAACSSTRTLVLSIIWISPA